ncbi:hypothetical protein M406DRAFT_331248 [Cryphonectria parasitica EP155]|uniref:Uncharacterized protein n=1 Tax=Cryphonectria parasitica (strain ATCC 38755 / EP155) TaxID=660469 RepID=A0A9P4Y1T5_CRYP1|nr:uncharacterized protein M406DRAFT_331248 [Cryphonectria parasitica EP155]KAF3764933.1 hypothetical protein M406DRAFT_331248 [Cryphonectria parasitica EP155]
MARTKQQALKAARDPPQEPPRSKATTSRSKKQNEQNAAHQQSEQGWSKDVQIFRTALQDLAATDAVVQAAWKRLRQCFSNTFKAIIFPQTAALAPFEPFQFWAAENIGEDVLGRILRIEFADELASFNHFPMLKHTAVQSGTSIWHLLLIFGPTLFSDHRLKILRKRMYIFTANSRGKSGLADAYKRMLRYSATKRGVPIDTTSIPCAEPKPILFASDEISALGPANPEFERHPQQDDSKVEQTPQTQKFSQEEGRDHAQNRRRQDQGQDQDMRTPVPHAELIKNPYQAQMRKEKMQLPPLRGSPFIQRLQQRDIALPSTEDAGYFEEKAVGSSSTLQDDRHVILSNPDPSAAWTKEREPYSSGPLPSEGFSELTDFSERWSTAVHATSPAAAPWQCKQGTLRNISPSTTHARSSSSVSRKRPIKESPSEPNRFSDGSSKRMDKSESRDHLLEQAQHWDDETTLSILKQIEVVRSEKFIVVDDSKTYDNPALLQQVSRHSEERGTLLVPLRLDDGHCVLVVIRLKPLEYVGDHDKYGTIQYYDPARWSEGQASDKSDRTMRVARLISFMLPDRDPDPDAWHHQHCVCPDQLVRSNNRPAICLAAMCIVGSLQPSPPLPEAVDWVFWRHVILVSFLRRDPSLQLRFQHYRAETIEKTIRQGQALESRPPDGGSSSEQIQNSAQTVTMTEDRIRSRAANAKRLIGNIHQGYRIFHDLVVHIDQGNVSLKSQLDQNVLVRDRKRDNIIGIVEELSIRTRGAEDPEYKLLSSEGLELRQAASSIDVLQERLNMLHDAQDCVCKGMQELSEWREQINKAVMEGDLGMEHASME